MKWVVTAEWNILLRNSLRIRILLRCHADFDKTLKNVEETAAEYVVTDNTRGGNGVELAISIQRELGIIAIASKIDLSLDWG